jgi:hypothetical protein
MARQADLTSATSARRGGLRVTEGGSRFPALPTSAATIQPRAGAHVITAADPLPDELRQAIGAINSGRPAH